MKKIALIVSALVIMAGSAQAAEWNFYGSARVNTFWTDVDNAGGSSDKNLEMGLQGNSRVGANVKVSDTLTGRFEYGASGGSANLRYLYGVWNFGPGSLLVGQHEGPLRHPGSDQVYGDDAGLGGWGELSSPRKAQLKLILGTFRLALRAPDAKYNDGTSNVDTNTETRMPSIEAKYRFVGDNYNLGLSAGYHNFKVGPSGEESVSSYVLGIGGDVNFGGFILGANIFGGENVGNLIDADVNGGDTGNGYAVYSGGQVLDNEALGYKIHATYVFNDMISVHGGYGYMKTELDNAADKDDVQSYYLQLPLNLAPGVSVVPEIGVVDYKQDTAANKTTYLGAKWQIDF